MTKMFIGALIISGAFGAPVFAADDRAVTPDEFCTNLRLPESEQITCRAELTAATTDAARARVMERYQKSLTSTPPLRNDLNTNEAGVRRAKPPSGSSATGGATESAPPSHPNDHN